MKYLQSWKGCFLAALYTRWPYDREHWRGLAASYYGLELFTASAETHDAKAADGRLVQIKATQITRIALSSEPQWLLILRIHRDGTFSEEYNGPGKLAWEHCGKMQKTGSDRFPWQN